MSSSDDTLLQQNPTTRHVLPKHRAYYSSSDDSAAPTTPTRRSSDRVQVTRSRVSSPSSSEEEGACKRHEEEHRERRVKRSQEKSSNRRKHARSSSFVFDHPLVHHARTSSYAMYQQSVDIARNTISELDLPASSWCGFFAAAMLAVTLGEVVKINNAQTNPYMDEVFHVRQAQHFCAGNWTVWDSKITTLPGLYLLNAVIAHCAGFMTGKPNIEYCSLEKLRFVNIVMSVLIFVVMYTIFRKLSRRLKDDPGLGIQPIHRTCCMMNSLVLTCFPLLYFYNLLYYTDVGSVLFVLASYSCSIRNHHLKSAMLGAISVLFRQTNIIWVGFTAGTVVIRDIENRGLLEHCDDFFSQMEIAVKVILRYFWQYLLLLLPYLMVLAGFGVFIVLNGGIVVGDKSAHTAVLHFPQFLYFLLFLTAFSLPHMIQRLRHSHLTVLYYVFKPVHVLLFFMSAVLALYFFRYEHPYLLADNRHYTFYIWRKILNRTSYTMYYLLPVCFYTFLNIVALLSTVHSKFFTLLYFLCVASQIVPQGLLEFRYFILPYLLYRLHVPQHSWVVLFLELCQYTVINLVTVKIFLNKTFDWEITDSLTPNPQRFMW
ncbi:putative Dol-P-Glc:Glc(2)Man(9)GlcNAc(2)-PP-Dol alpha-1,2-glucosyltransferase isoform X1 [Bolinopsis microptera]|uniref:putative Dol-P-Glc:Glc(2)Man(9)GlcNAc(2)-PP-Dol alpha-1,2-glucosyltransferase isoform X1 n=3 Tax=Bolinopsis microptera TaxID=2820187 RepID=UPI0030790F5F